MSTLSQSLAVLFMQDTLQRVLLLDASRYPSIRRDPSTPAKLIAPPLQIAQAPHGQSLEGSLEGCQGVFDRVVLDTGMQTPKVFAELVERASVLVVPLAAQDALFEAATHIGRFGRKYRADGLSKTAFALNQAPSIAQKKARMDLIAEFGAGVRICQTTLAQRTAYQGGTMFNAEDMAAQEAAAELRSLCRELFDPSVCFS